MKTLVIGDIHGCYRELLLLLDKAGISRDDRIIAVGDLVNKGPDSPHVLEFFRTYPNATSIMGNHELKHIGCFEGYDTNNLAVDIARKQIGNENYERAIDQMRTFPHYLELDDALIVHAFLEPGVSLKKQQLPVLAGQSEGEEYLKQKHGWPWYKKYKTDKPIICGHRDYDSSGKITVWRDRLFAIDTRCCEGYALTGILLPEFKVITVPSPKNYWSEMKSLYKDLKKSSKQAATRAFSMKWRKLERAIEDARHSHFNPSKQDKHLEKIEQTLEEGERRLARLHHYIMEMSEETDGDVHALPGIRDLPNRRRKKLLAETDLGHLHPLLERAQTGTLTTETLKERFRKPRDVYEIMSLLGLE